MRAGTVLAPGRRAQRILVGGLIAIALGVTLFAAVNARDRILRRERDGRSTEINDFTRWMAMTPAFLREGGGYVDDRLPNPPIVLLLWAPLSRLPVADAQVVWIAVKPLLAAGILLLARSMVRAAGARLTPAALWLVAATWLWPVIGDIQAGQTDLLMLLPLVAGLRLAQSPRTGAPWGAGLLIALAIAIKVTPLAFAAYFAYRRRWRLLAGLGAGLFLWLLALPGLVFGWGRNLRWLGEWSRIMALPYVARGEVEYFVGQSVPSVLTRLLRHVPAIVPRDGGLADARYLNVLDLPEPVVAWVIRGVLLGLVVAGWIWARRPLPDLRSRRYVLEAGAVAAFMLWASPRTWVPHYVTLILTLAAAAMVASDPGESPRLRQRARAALVAAAALMALTTDLVRPLGPLAGEYVRSFGVSLWASVGLVAVLVSARGSPVGPGPGGSRIDPGLRPDPAAPPAQGASSGPA